MVRYRHHDARPSREDVAEPGDSALQHVDLRADWPKPIPIQSLVGSIASRSTSLPIWAG